MCSHKYGLFPYANAWFTFKYQILQLSSIGNLNLKILVATSDVQNSTVFTDLQIQACKSFKELATGAGSADAAASETLPWG